MMDDVILYASIIRNIFEKIRFDHSLIEQFNNYNKLFTKSVNDIGIEDVQEKSAYITLGIAFALQSFTKDSAHFYKQKEKYVKYALKYLTAGIVAYANKRWKAECAFWCIFVLGKNEIYVNDLLCDTLMLQNLPVTIENIKIIKYFLIESLFDLTCDIDLENCTYNPLYNEDNNGLNEQMVHQLHYDWMGPGADLCEEKGLMGSDFIHAQEKKAFETFIKTII